jgi:thymidylate synthase (FAD)
MGERIDVLDHGYVGLVRWMGPETDDEFIPPAARISTGAGSKGATQDRRLLGRLARLYHSSPFEHAVFTFKVRAPLFVTRQWQRHRTWKYWSPSEASQRYAVPVPLACHLPAVADIRAAPLPGQNKQAGREFASPDAWAVRSLARRDMERLYRQASAAYESLVARGVALEQARAVLPLATYTEFFGTVDLWNLADFWRLRLDAGAQAESRAYAEATFALAHEHAPLCCAALWAALEAEGGPLGEGGDR